MTDKTIQSVTDQILIEGHSVESVLNEGFVGRTAKELSRQAASAMGNFATMVAAGALLSLAGAIVSKLMSPKIKSKQHKLVADFYPYMIREALENIKPELSDLIMSGATGVGPDVSSMMNKTDAKIDRVIDRYLPKIFKALGNEIRNDVKDMVQWEVEKRVDKYVRDATNMAQQHIGQSF